MANQGSWLVRRFGVVAFVCAALFAACVVWFALSSRRVWPPWAWRDQARVYPCEPAARADVDGDLGEWAVAPWAPLVGADRRGLDGCVALRWNAEALYVAARVRAGRVESSADERRRGGCGLELEVEGLPGLWIAPRFPRRQAALALVSCQDAGAGGFEFVDVASKVAAPGWVVGFDAAGRPYLPALDMDSGLGLGEGWGPARKSPDGLWTRPVVGRRARLVLPALGARRMRLTLCGEPAGLAEGVSQRVTVYLNGQRVGVAPEGEWRSRRVVDVDLPATAMVEGVNEVILDFDREDGAPLRKGGRGVAAWMEAVSLSPVEGGQGPAPRLLAAGDVNGDGREDVCGVADGRLFAWSPAAAWGWVGGPAALKPRLAAVGDLDNDGDNDIAALDETGETLHLLTPAAESSASFPFGAAPLFEDKARPGADAERWRGMVIADVNDDGENELAALSDKEIVVLALRDKEWRGLQRLPAPAGAQWLFWGDFDGDGRGELAVLSRPAEDKLAVHLWGPGPAGLAAWQGQLELGGRIDVAEASTGDLDGDGRSEIVLAAPAGGAGRRLVSLTLRPQRVDDLGVVKDAAGWLAANITGGARPGQGDGGGVAMTVLPPPKPAAKDAKAPARKPARKARVKPGEEKPDFAPVEGSRTNAVRTAEGYDIEARIPWAALKARAPSPGGQALWRARLDPGGDAERQTPRRGVVQQREAVEFLALPLPAKPGQEMARYLPALTAVRLTPRLMAAGETVTVEVFKGLAPGRARRVEGLALEGWNGGGARAWREETDDDLGCEVETWKARCEGLADGGVVAVARTGWGATAMALGESRVWAVASALDSARRLEARLLRLAPKGPPAAATLLARVQSEKVALERDPSRLAKAGPELAKLGKLLRMMEKGGGRELDKALQEPLRGYWCEIDDSVQPFAVSVPDSYTPRKSWPLVVCLHGAGYDPARRVGAPKRQDAIALAPHGRGWTDYMGIGEADVFRAIDLVRQQYNVDPDRISITGGSMGGTGSWQLATRRPDLFSALAPVCGNSDSAVWESRWGPFYSPDDPMRAFRRLLLDRIAPATFAANLINTPALAVHGLRDRVVYPEASDIVVDRLREAGAMPILRQEPKAGHGVPSRAREGAWEWLLSQRRVERPARVRLVSADPGQRQVHWLRLERKTTALAIADLDAEVGLNNEIRVKAANVDSFSIDVNPWRAPARRNAETLLAPGAWGAEGGGAVRVTEGAATLSSDGRSEWPQAVFRIEPPASPAPEWVSVRMWIKQGRKAPGTVKAQLRRYRPEAKLVAAAPAKEPPPALAEVEARPDGTWQAVSVSAWLDPKSAAPLACAVVMDGHPQGGDVMIQGARVLFGSRPDWPLGKSGASWLASGERAPGGWFPWRPANRADATDWRENRRFTVAELGETTDLFDLDGEAGQAYVAGAWGKGPAGAVLNVEVLDKDGKRLAAAQQTLAETPALASLRLERPAGVRKARVRVWARGGAVEVERVFCLKGAAIPDVFRRPPGAGSLDLSRPVRVVMNGNTAFEGMAPEDGLIRIGEPAPAVVGLAKTDQIRGPIEHAFESPFVVVYGTQGPYREWRATRDEAEVFADDWRVRYATWPRVKADRDVTPLDVARYNLVLYGGPAVNAVSARLAGSLPVRVEDGAIVAGGYRFDGADAAMKVVHPNPLNPERYVVMFASNTWRGMFQMTKRLGNWFGWRYYENRSWQDFAVFDDTTRDPASMLLFGFFDNQWRMTPEGTFSGIPEWRRRIPARATPTLARPDATRAETQLSSVEPLRMDMRKGTAGLDRSYQGNPLRPGGVECARGIGAQVGSAVTWRNAGVGQRFKALVGVDNEGEDPTPERKRNTRVRFEVWGDGRLLGASSVLRWNDPAESMDVDIRGVEYLTLKITARGGTSWVYGSASWGEARVTRER